MRLLFAILTVLSWVLPAVAQSSIGIGQNAPTAALQDLFLRAWYRNRFYLIVYPYPTTDVRRIGTAGLVQLFETPERTPRVRYALIKADATQPVYTPSTGPAIGDVFQVDPGVWTAITTLNNVDPTNAPNLNTTGFPNMDSEGCPPVAGIACRYSTTDKNFAVFAFEKPLSVLLGQSTVTRDPFFTRWKALGGAFGLGPAATAEQTIEASSAGSTATYQTFLRGQMFNVTAGLTAGRLFTVTQPVYDFYLANGGVNGFLGLPTSDDIVLASGSRRQTFEGGTIEYTPGGGDPVLLLPVSAVLLTEVPNPLRLTAGASANVRVVLLAPDNTELTDRAVNWLTSNGRVVTVEQRPGGATLKAVGGGTATVTAISEGKSSSPLIVYVDAPCCQPGDGAPTATIRQAFEDTVSRNNLPVRLPTPSPARRLGAGYWQDFQTSSDPAFPLAIAVGDSRPTGFYLVGDLLARYLSLQGALGPLGYPISDATTGGRQLFENRAALAGRPVHLVSNGILAAWAAAGYETGALGSPTGESAAVTSFSATAGFSQPFERGSIHSATAGLLAGRSYPVLTSFHDKYQSLGGPAGALGFPMSAESSAGGRRVQEFEGAFLEQTAPSSEIKVTTKERQPSISATPNPVNAGGRVRLSFGGFPSLSTVRVSIGGRPDFVVTTESGSYAWPLLVPVTARSETIRVRAVTVGGEAAAETTYSVRSLTDARVTLNKIRGDDQVGAPGATLPQPLRVSLRDSAGNPLPGIPVTFEASPGGAVSPATALTGETGEAETRLRLPAREGVALATASVSGRVVTFSARLAASSLTNFPALTQDLNEPLGAGPATISQRGALLASTAAIVQFHQNRGDIPAPSGLATVSGLNQFLRTYCVASVSGGELICDGFLPSSSNDLQIVNLYRVPAFAGSGFSFRAIPPATVADFIAAGSPVLLAMDMQRDGVPAGSHFVVATGITASGDLELHDPSPFFNKPTLASLTTPFPLNGQIWKGVLSSAVILDPAQTLAGGFLVTGDARLVVSSATGPCGLPMSWLDVPSTSAAPVRTPHPIYQCFCPGTALNYQLDLVTADRFQLQLTDLASPGRQTQAQGTGAGGYLITKRLTWEILPQVLILSPQGVINAASGLPLLAPGTLASLSGTGLQGREGSTVVQVAGQGVPVTSTSAFRVTFAIPDTLAAGDHPVEVLSPFGSATTEVQLAGVAPALFASAEGRGVIINADGQINSPLTPARRSESIRVSATGLGPLRSPTLLVNSVTAWIEGRELATRFAGLDPAMPGIYWMELLLPSNLAPGDRLSLSFVQSGIPSNSVTLSVE